MTMIITALLSLVSVSSAFAHGEDEPGPNGGSIRMPGAFHTELVKTSDQKFKIYLLDMEWKNPVVTASTVEAIHKFGKTNTPASCEAKSNYFLCSLPRGSTLRKGTLTIQSSREKNIGGPAVYLLPLH